MFGSVLAGGAVYSYVLQEYKASNELLTEDIYVCLPNELALALRSRDAELSFLLCHFLSTSLTASKHILKSKSFANGIIDQTLQASVTRLTNHVKILEEKIQQKRK